MHQVEAIEVRISGAEASGDMQHVEELRGKLVSAEAEYEAGKKRMRSGLL